MCGKHLLRNSMSFRVENKHGNNRPIWSSVIHYFEMIKCYMQFADVFA